MTDEEANKDDSPAEATWEAQAIKKAARLRQARRPGDNSLYTLAQVGVLAWMFLLPVLLAGWISHFALRDSSDRWMSVPLLVLGVLIGAAFVRRKVAQLLAENKDDESS